MKYTAPNFYGTTGYAIAPTRRRRQTSWEPLFDPTNDGKIAVDRDGANPRRDAQVARLVEHHQQADSTSDAEADQAERSSAPTTRSTASLDRAGRPVRDVLDFDAHRHRHHGRRRRGERAHRLRLARRLHRWTDDCALPLTSRTIRRHLFIDYVTRPQVSGRTQAPSVLVAVRRVQRVPGRVHAQRAPSEEELQRSEGSSTWAIAPSTRRLGPRSGPPDASRP